MELGTMICLMEDLPHNPKLTRSETFFVLPTILGQTIYLNVSTLERPQPHFSGKITSKVGTCIGTNMLHGQIADGASVSDEGHSTHCQTAGSHLEQVVSSVQQRSNVFASVTFGLLCSLTLAAKVQHCYFLRLSATSTQHRLVLLPCG